MKSLIWDTPVAYEEDLVARVMAEADVGGPKIGNRVYQNSVCVDTQRVRVRSLVGCIYCLGVFPEFSLNSKTNVRKFRQLFPGYHLIIITQNHIHPFLDDDDDGL